MHEPTVEVLIDGVNISGDPPYTERVEPIDELRGILKAVRIITGCPKSVSILTHIATITRRYKMFVDREGCVVPRIEDPTL